MNETTNKLPTTFWIIAIIAILWNAMGLYSFFAQVFISEESLASLPEAERALYGAYPSWMNIVFASATIGGFLGSIGLVLKKIWSIPFFLISLIAVLIQMPYSFFFTNTLEVFGPTYVIMPLIVTIIALYLYYYSRQCKSKGWLN